MMPMPPSSAWTIAIGARVTVSMLAETIGRFSVIRRESWQVRSIRDGSRLAMMLRCGVKMKSSNVQPRVSSSRRAATRSAGFGKCIRTFYAARWVGPRGACDVRRATCDVRRAACGVRESGVPLRELERTLRVRLAETLPGVEAQMRFAPAPQRTGWKAGYFPEDAR